MLKRFLKIFSISLASVLLLIVLLLFLVRVYSPSYFIPYLIQQVENQTNGRYTLTINSDSVRVRFVSMTLNLGHTEFKRDSSVQVNSGIDFLDQFDVFASFNSLNINSLHFLKLAFSKHIIVDAISLVEPRVLIRKNIYYSAENNVDLKKEEMASLSEFAESDSTLADTLAMQEFRQSRNAILPYFEVKQFSIEDLSFEIYDGRKRYPLREVHGLDFNVVRFTSDKHGKVSVDDANLYIDSVSNLVSKNIARLTAWGVYINPDSVHVSKLKFGHIVDPYRMNRIRGFRSSWINLLATDIDIEGLHPSELINDSTMVIDKVTLGSARLDFFKDKVEPKINPAYKALPPEQIRGIPIALKVDTVEINNTDLYIDMEAPKADAPGRITLNDMNARITNITNLPRHLGADPVMRLNTSFKIMNEVPLTVGYKFDITSEESIFSASVSAEPFDATILNGFVGSQFFIEFASGQVERFEFTFNGNDRANVGTMDFEYRNLKVRKLRGYEKYIEGKPKTGFVSSVGNFLIPRNRTSDKKKYKTAAIYYEKEYNRDFIHGTIMAMLSGVMSSFGLSSRNVAKMQDKASQLDETDQEKSAVKAQQQADKVDKQSEKSDKKSEKADKKADKKADRQSRKDEKKEKKESKDN